MVRVGTCEQGMIKVTKIVVVMFVFFFYQVVDVMQ